MSVDPAQSGFYQYLFENNPLPAWLYDLETLRFVAVNHVACLRYGYTREEFLSMTLRDIRPAEDLPALLNNVQSRRETFQQSGPWRHRTRAGEMMLVEISSHEMTYEGRAARLVVVNDVTGRERAKAALERSNRELQDFAYAVSHDLQEPLRTICSFAELIATRYRDRLDENAREFLGYIQQSAARLQQMIVGLLNYSRVLHREPVLLPVDLNEVVATVWHSLGQAVEEAGATIAASALPTIVADRDGMNSLFQNLFANALKYRGPAAPEIRVQAAADTDTWHLSVADNGIGIDPKYHVDIFRVFERIAPEAAEGTGIGLTLCKKIVERHGGSIWVESQLGHGSVFHFTIPAQQLQTVTGA